ALVAHRGPLLHGNLVSVAGVAARGERLHLISEVGEHHLAVPLEAAAGQDDTLAGADPPSTAGVVHDHADHRASAVDHQLLGGGRALDLPAVLEHGMEERPDEGGALDPHPGPLSTSQLIQVGGLAAAA